MNNLRHRLGLFFGLTLMFVTGTATAHVGLIAPDGGEQLQVGGTFTIEWEILIQHNQLNWDLHYSTKSNSGPWIPLAIDLPPGPFNVGSVHTYEWLVPADAEAPQVWVRAYMDNAGTDYWDVSAAPFTIHPKGPLPPPNDNCTSAILVFEGDHDFTTISATTDGGIEKECSDFNDDVWFRYGSQCEGTLTIDMCNADFDSVIGVYQGCPTGDFESIACNDDSCGLQSQIVMPVTTGLYWIRIGGTSGQQGTGTMSLTCVLTPPCPGDVFEDGTVDVTDLLSLLAAWGSDSEAYDITPPGGDGIVDILDLLTVLSSWGPCPS